MLPPPPARAAIPVMRAGGGGSIVVDQALMTLPDAVAYVALKGGATMLAKALAVDDDDDDAAAPAGAHHGDRGARRERNVPVGGRTRRQASTGVFSRIARNEQPRRADERVEAPLSIAAIIASTEAGLATSTAIAPASPPRRAAGRRDLLRPFRRQIGDQDEGPLPANASAMARPIPDPPPVTMTRFPRNRPSGT